MTSTSTAIREISAAARPLIKQALDLTEQFAALRDAATAKGLDWGQLKGLLKAQIQDERDESGGGRRIRRIIEKADYAASYADLLGLTPNMNENNYFPETRPAVASRLDGAADDEGTQPVSVASSAAIIPEPQPAIPPRGQLVQAAGEALAPVRANDPAAVISRVLS